MPELPEVETIAAALRQGGRDGPPITGRRVVDARVFWARTLAHQTPNAFRKRVAGQVIREVRRRGKFLWLALSRDALLIHLRMSGDVIVATRDTAPRPHDRLALGLGSGLRVVFNDPRKFGRVWLTDDPERIFADLGPEPLDPGFTPREFHERLRARRRRLKPLLLDQSFLAGLGNIYADEALHASGLHPLRSSDRLSCYESEKLLSAIRQVLREGIRRNGASIDWVYRGGDFQNHFRVYGREGADCPACASAIVRIVVGQRGTHFCPGCQSLNEML
ncbi:MAG: bifunctional DNA-formamidopyrimidine glycosylase/DNA-(apurinic or apyrimidinic site) lyase [Planctomycetes bacterium]|nr:bifunctional DNA-formamidopyrimidine glycosylase/DNA-(apurinic or apyrimidinic site) lyase [Planctomycetota bacterium]